MSIYPLLPSTRCVVVTKTMMAPAIRATPLLLDLQTLIFDYADFTYADEVEFDERPGYFQRRWDRLVLQGNRLFRKIALATDLFRSALNGFRGAHRFTDDELFEIAMYRIDKMYDFCPQVFDLAVFPTIEPPTFTPFAPENWTAMQEGRPTTLDTFRNDGVRVSLKIKAVDLLPPFLEPYDQENRRFLMPLLDPTGVLHCAVAEQLIHEGRKLRGARIPLADEITGDDFYTWSLGYFDNRRAEFVYHREESPRIPTHNGVPITEWGREYREVRNGVVVRISEAEFLAGPWRPFR